MNHTMLTVMLAGAFSSTTSAQNWLDNFNDGSAVDGSPVTWVGSPAFASQFTVTNGDLFITMPAGASPAISSPRVSINFPTGASVRARMVAFNGPGRFAVALADQPTGIQGYVASFSTSGGGTVELFRGDVLGSIVFLGKGTLPWSYSPLTEHYLQLDVFNGVVSARVWRPGEPFPAPQITAADTTYSGGVASIAIQDFGGASSNDVSAVVRFAQASATPLTHSGIGDINADGGVNIDDLLNVINTWGPCPAGGPTGPGDCPADLNGDDVVNIDDLLTVINNWG